MLHESGPFRVTPHRQPAWKIVLPLGGTVAIRFGDGRGLESDGGVIVPPQVSHTCEVSSEYVALTVDSWALAAGSTPSRIEADAARRMRSAALPRSDDEVDVEAVRAELYRVAPRSTVKDERVVRALRAIAADHDASIASIAQDLTLSAPRLRALVRGQVPVPLARLRLWARLNAAVAGLPASSVAAVAAATGFADQAHLTRTARGLIGRTFSEFGPPSAPPRPARRRAS